MDGMSLEERKRQAELRMNQEREQLRKQGIQSEVGMLNRWDMDKTETAERQRAAFAENIVRNKEKTDSRFRAAVASYDTENIKLFGVAAGEPVEELEPAKRAKCRSRQDRQRAALAKDNLKKHAPDGAKNSLIQERLDGNSYRIQLELEKEIVNLEGNMAAHGEMQDRPDYAVMKAFSGFSPEFVDDYRTERYEKRKKYLRWMTDDLLQQELSTEHFIPEFLAQSGGQMYRIVMRFKAYRTAYEDPVNRPFFENLSETEKQLIRVRILDMADLYENALRFQCRCCGVGMDDGQYLTEDAQLAALPKELTAVRNFSGRILERNEKTQTAVMKGYVAGMEEAKRETLAQQQERERQIREEEPQLQGTGLTGFLVGYAPQDIQDIRALFSENMESYEANKPLLDLMEQEFFHVLDARTDFMRRIAQQENLRLGLDPMAGAGTLLQRTFGNLAVAEAERLDLLQTPLENRLNVLKDAIKAVTKNREPESAEAAKVIKEFRRKIKAKQPGLEAQLDAMTAGWKEARLQPPDDPEVQAHTYYTGKENLMEYRAYLTGYESTRYVASLKNLGITKFFADEVEAGRMSHKLVQMSGGEVTGLDIGRMVINVNIMTVLGGLTVEQGKEMLRKLSQGEMGENGTAEKDAATLEGVLMYKRALLTYLRGLEQKYGKLLTQLHPEDVLRRVNIHELAMEMKPMQDMVQLMDDNKTGVPFFDYANEEDQEYKRLASYFFQALYLYSTYARLHIEMGPEMKEGAREDLTGILNSARKFEDGIGGPSLKSSQMPYYAQSVRERYGEDKNYLHKMSFGRW